MMNPCYGLGADMYLCILAGNDLAIGMAPILPLTPPLREDDVQGGNSTLARSRLRRSRPQAPIPECRSCFEAGNPSSSCPILSSKLDLELLGTGVSVGYQKLGIQGLCSRERERIFLFTQSCRSGLSQLRSPGRPSEWSYNPPPP